MDAPHGRSPNVWKKARQQLRKNAASNSEQVLETAPTKHQLYGHLPPIMKTIKIRRTRHAEHCWRSRDELVSDVLLWTSSRERAKAGRPARIYIQQLCADTGCSPEDLPKAMDDREWWRERVRNIRHDDESSVWLICPFSLFLDRNSLQYQIRPRPLLAHLH